MTQGKVKLMIIDGEEKNVITVIMAAGKGTRMKSEKSKLVHKIYDKELVKRVADVAKEVGSDEVVAVVGYLKEQVIDVLGNSVEYAYQEELLGTGHAVMQATKYLEGKKGKAIILYGDVPIIRKETLINLVTKDPSSYIGHKMLAEIYEAEGGMRKAIDEYVKVIDIQKKDCLY